MQEQLSTVKTVLAVLVIEKLITKKKAEHALSIVESQYIRGVILPVEFGTLIKILSKK